jgi:hypothetical protein
MSSICIQKIDSAYQECNLVSNDCILTYYKELLFFGAERVKRKNTVP